MSARPVGGTGTEWHPALWLRALTEAPPAPWPTGRSVRAAISVAGPLVVGALTDHLLIGMWISMGTLLLAAGERSVSYSARFRQIMVTAPLAAAAYLLGMLSTGPHVLVVVVMAGVAFVSGILSGYDGALSVGTMQAMLIAALALGLPVAAPYWPAAGYFLVGAVIYALMLGLEAMVDRRRPQREALVGLLRALGDLARAQARGSTDLATSRACAIGAIDAFHARAIRERGSAHGPMHEYDRAATIVRAADQLLARLIAHDADRSLSGAAADRPTVCADAAAHRRHPPSPGTEPGSLVRLAMLEAAIWDNSAALDPFPIVVRARLSLPGNALLASAGRLSLCTALAYSAFYLLPIPHGYWIPLTVALVMKPDLGSVFARAVLRSIGTVGGAVGAVVISGLIHDSIVSCFAIAVLAACLPWAMARSYLWQALFLTPLIMILIDVVVPADRVLDLGLDRIATTFIGGLIVIVAGYVIWPSTRHAQVTSSFGEALGAMTRYARDVAENLDTAAIGAERQKVYRLLSNTRVELQRTLSEPPPAGSEAWAWIPVISAAERVADTITSASASRTPPDTVPGADELAALADDLESIAQAGPVDERDERSPTLPAHGDSSPEASVRTLADELANLRPMLSHSRAIAPEHPRRSR